MPARARRGERGQAATAALLLLTLLCSLLARALHPVLTACPCLHGTSAESVGVVAPGDEARQVAAPDCLVCALSASPSPSLVPEPQLGLGATVTGAWRGADPAPAPARAPPVAWTSRAPPAT